MTDSSEQIISEFIRNIYLYKYTKNSNYKSFLSGHFQMFTIIWITFEIHLWKYGFQEPSLGCFDSRGQWYAQELVF